MGINENNNIDLKRIDKNNSPLKVHDQAMINYKGVKIQKEIHPFMKYMESVEEYREELSTLASSWDNLTVMGQLGHSNIDMSSTKQSFANLTEELLNHLGSETLKKAVREMTAKAQIAVDIVIRNLFERTADIGFLATDDDLRYFLQNTKSKYDSSYDENVIKIKQRFEEYVQKYSVYFDIVLMDTMGNILVSLDDSIDIKQSKDEIIDIVLNTNDDYVETFKYHDFLPNYKKTLVYSYKVTQTNEKDSKTIGILSLCFRFTDEMKGIFNDLINPSTQECITLLDHSGKVIASSDIYHIPLGATLELCTESMYKVVSFGGRYYLCKTCSTNGYQGFMGLGWYGHIMVPIEHAFSIKEDNFIDIKDEVLQAILQHGEGFTDQLKQIPVQAEEIQNNLHRAVWNGNISQTKDKDVDKSFSRLLLKEISKIGDKTKNIFNSSIINLTKTMILNDTVSIASLMIDIMDRNLYERSNDCRWWALSSSFRTTLGNEILTQTDKDKLCNILAYINDLYTVYTNLFIYDTKGIIVAVSKEDQKYLIGKQLKNPWVEKALMIKDSSKYCVSDFEQSELYDNKHTYIYNASIKSLEDSNTIVGGIGIVFDSEVEFYDMIKDSLPRYVTGEIKSGVFGVFTTKDKMVISSNNDTYKVGSILDLDEKFFNLRNGESYSEIITLEDKFYAVGVKCSAGYREYKSAKDDYVNDVYSFFFSYISEANIPIKKTTIEQDEEIVISECDGCKEIATFYIGNKHLGVEAQDVLEAVSINELEASISLDKDHYFKGSIIYNKNAISVLDINQFIQGNNTSEYKDIIVLNYKGNSNIHFIGLLVNSLDDIVDIKEEKIKPIESHFISGGSLIESIVVPENSSSNNLLTLLNIEKLGDDLTKE
jgi:chemotaxis signal transduction protein